LSLEADILPGRSPQSFLAEQMLGNEEKASHPGAPSSTIRLREKVCFWEYKPPAVKKWNSREMLQPAEHLQVGDRACKGWKGDGSCCEGLHSFQVVGGIVFHIVVIGKGKLFM